MAAPVILIDATPRRPSDGVGVPVQLAGGGARLPFPPGYRGQISTLPTVSAALDFAGQEMGGGGIPQSTVIPFAPSSSAVLAEVAGYYWHDAAIAIRIGAEGAALPPIMLAGRVLEAPVDGGTLQIAIADPAADLKRPVIVDRFSGTGDLEGPVELAGTVKARSWGKCFNVAGRPLDPAHAITCFGDPTRRWQAIDVVRDRGAPADPADLVMLDWQGSAEATLAALRLAVPPEGGGVLAPDIASIKWWAETSDLTADVRGEVAGGYVQTAAGIVARIVASRSTLAFAAGTIAAATAARPAVFGWRIDDDTTTAADAVSAILGDVSTSWLLVGGQIVLRPWIWGVPTVRAKSFSVKRRETLRPVATRKIGYRRNCHPVSRGDLAAVVFAQDVVFEDGKTIGEKIDEAVGPETLTGGGKVALIATVEALEARYLDLHNAYLAVYSSAAGGFLPGSDPRVLLNANAVVARSDLYTFLDAIPPAAGAWRDTGGSSPVDPVTLNDALEAFEAALATFDTGMKLGAPDGTMVGKVPAETVAQAVILSLQNTQAIVAGGTLTPEAKTYIAKELAFFQERSADLTTRATPLGVSPVSMAADLTAFASYVTGLPNWSNPAVASAVNPTTYNNLAASFRASSALLEGTISARIAAGSRTADELVAGNSTIRIVGDQVRRDGSAASYQVVYSKFSTKGDAFAKARVLSASALPVVIGLSRKTDAASATISSILAGLRVYMDGSTKKVSKIVNGAVVGTWNADEAFAGDVWLGIGYFEAETGGKVIFTVSSPAKPNEQVLATSPGQELVFKALMYGGGSIDNVVFHSKEKIAYEAIDGAKPPVDATAGGNVIRPDVVITGTTGPDAEGFFTFDAIDTIELTGNYDSWITHSGEPYVKITVDRKDDSGVGDAFVRIIYEGVTSNGGLQMNARDGSATLAFPLGVTRYRVQQGVAFTAGSIKMKRAVVMPTQDAGTAGTDGGAPAADAGVDITTFFQLQPSVASAAAYGQYGMYAPGGSDTGLLDFRNGDRIIYNVEAGVHPSGYTRVLGAKWLYVGLRNSPPGNTGSGSVTMTVRFANNAAGTGSVLGAEIGLGGSGREYVEVPAGYTHVKIEAVAAVTSGFLRIAWPEMFLRAVRVTAQDLIDVAKPVETPAAAIDAPPSYYLDYVDPVDPEQKSFGIVEMKLLSAIGFAAPTADAKVAVTTTVEYGKDLANVDRRTAVNQNVVVDGVTYFRRWWVFLGMPAGAWIGAVASGPETPEKHGWAKVFSQAALPRISDITDQIGGVKLSDAMVMNAAVSITAAGVMVGGSPNAQPINALLIQNGPTQAGADPTAANIVNFTPIDQIDVAVNTSGVPTAGQFPITRVPVLKQGLVNKTANADWAIGTHPNLTLAINNTPGAARGTITLSGITGAGTVPVTANLNGQAVTQLLRVNVVAPPPTPTSINHTSFALPANFGTNLPEQYKRISPWLPLKFAQPYIYLDYLVKYDREYTQYPQGARLEVALVYNSQGTDNGGFSTVDSPRAGTDAINSQYPGLGGEGSPPTPYKQTGTTGTFDPVYLPGTTNETRYFALFARSLTGAQVPSVIVDSYLKAFIY